MRSLPVFFLVLVSLLLTNESLAFTMNKRETDGVPNTLPVLKASSSSRKESSNKKPVGSNPDDESPQQAMASSPSGMISVPTSHLTAAGAAAAVQVPVHEEEVDISYGVAMVSCVLSLALGFGLGYGT